MNAFGAICNRKKNKMIPENGAFFHYICRLNIIPCLFLLLGENIFIEVHSVL
jgi:hypothetical protein